MAENLYLYLVNGRCVHVTDDWDGNEPTRIGTVDAAGDPDDGEGIEAGEYFRDIYRTTVSAKVAPSSAAYPPAFRGTLMTLNGALVPTTVEVKKTAEDAGSIGVYDLSVTGVTPSGSDDHLHEKPRGWQKVCTWLVFSCTTGTQKRAFRAASVDGWGDQPPIDD